MCNGEERRGSTGGGARDWMFVASQISGGNSKLYPLNMMILGGGASGRWFGHEGGSPINGISALIKGTPASSLSLFSPCEDTRSWKTLNQHPGFRRPVPRTENSVQFSFSVMSDSLQPHGLQHAGLPCPSPTPGVHSNSHPLSLWCHPTISSSVIPFSSCLQSFPASGPSPMSVFYTSGGQSIGVSASASALPMDIQGWFPQWLTASISLLPKGLSRVFSNTSVQKPQFFSTQLALYEN